MNKSDLKQLVREVIQEVQSSESTCQKCKGQGHYTTQLKDLGGKNTHGMGNTHIFPCDSPTCRGGKVDKELSDKYYKDIADWGKKSVNEVQWDLQTPEGQAKYQAGVDKRIGAQVAGLQKKIDADKRKQKAQPILNKKPFKKPFNEFYAAGNGDESDMSNSDEAREVQIGKEILKLIGGIRSKPHIEQITEMARVLSQIAPMAQELVSMHDKNQNRWS